MGEGSRKLEVYRIYAGFDEDRILLSSGDGNVADPYRYDRRGYAFDTRQIYSENGRHKDPALAQYRSHDEWLTYLGCICRVKDTSTPARAGYTGPVVDVRLGRNHKYKTLDLRAVVVYHQLMGLTLDGGRQSPRDDEFYLTICHGFEPTRKTTDRC